jgi:thiol-disulfide isomerase/thioredoxin
MSCSTPNKIIVNKKITDPEGEPMLIGRITRDALTAPEFNDWYSSEYNSYIPDRNVTKRLKGRVRLYTIEVFMGTWCSDTQEQLPRFLKVLDEANYPKRKLHLYALNRKKESFYGEQGQKAIFSVPTFIVYKTVHNKRRGNKEVGRIVEAPSQTLELDLYKIITGKNFEEKEVTKEKNKKTRKIKTKK